MTVIRTHKIALDPTPEQQRLLARLAGYANLAYNWALRHYKRTHEAGSPCPASLLSLFWDEARTAAYPWSSQLPQNAAKYAGSHAVYALEKAIKAWENSNRKNEFPKPHYGDKRASFRAAAGSDSVEVESKGIKLPDIGTILTREDLRFTGKIQTVTVKREAGRWFACVSMEVESPECPGTEIIGIDVGGRKMVVCSDGTTYTAPESLGNQWGRIRRYRGQLARQTKGSARRRRVRHKLERAVWRASYIRDDAQHKAASKIVAKAHTVVLETLGISAMMEEDGRRLERGIAAAALSRMQRKIIYRCEAAGVEVIMAPPDFASSQICSGCGNRKTGKMRLRDEEIYQCDGCGLVIDRDVNAAINLKHYAEEQLGKRRNAA